jgi:aryl-alcohol dehydrogenase-like predicted oxidoreductase
MCRDCESAQEEPEFPIVFVIKHLDTLGEEMHLVNDRDSLSELMEMCNENSFGLVSYGSMA